MDKPVTISVVAPIYGVEKYIGQFAESVLAQPYEHVQLIFVNDGTKDFSMDILNAAIARWPRLSDRIRVVNKENGGLPAARKTGMEYVTGDYVWHVDPDDWIEPDAFSRIAEFASANGYPDVIYFDFFKVYPDRSKHKKEREYSADLKTLYIRNMYSHKSYGCVWNKCVKRSVYIDGKVGFPTYSYGEDTFLTTQLIGFSNTIAHLKSPLYHYRKGNPNAITRQNRKKRHREYAMNFLDLYEKYKDSPADKNPVSVIEDDILIQAGWYSLKYGLNLFKSRPYLTSAIRKARIRTCSNVNLPAQLLTKLLAFLIKKTGC